MSQLSKFPQDPGGSKKKIDNAGGINSVNTFYNETTGNSDINFTAATNDDRGGILKTTADLDFFRFVSFSLKKAGAPTNKLRAVLLDENDNEIEETAFISASTLTASYADITFDFGAVYQFENTWRLVLRVGGSLSDVNFVQLENDTLTTTSGFSKTTRDATTGTWTDDSTDSPVMTANKP